MADYKVTDTELTSIANAIRAKTGGSAQIEFPAEFVSEIGRISGGGGSTNILSGMNIPTASLGSNGDVYLLYSGVTLKNSLGQYINTGYNGSEDSKYVIEFIYEEEQTSQYPTPFGARASAGVLGNGAYIHTGYNNNHSASRVVWGGNEMNAFPIGDASMIGKLIKMELSAGHTVLMVGANEYEYDFTPQTVTDTTSVGIFAMLAGGSGQSYTYTKGMAFSDMKIYENNTLVHHFVPALDGNDVPCVYDEIDDEYKYNEGDGSFVYSEGGVVYDAYCKVNGAWQNLIGTDIDDVNTGE